MGICWGDIRWFIYLTNIRAIYDDFLLTNEILKDQGPPNEFRIFFSHEMTYWTGNLDLNLLLGQCQGPCRGCRSLKRSQASLYFMKALQKHASILDFVALYWTISVKYNIMTFSPLYWASFLTLFKLWSSFIISSWWSNAWARPLYFINSDLLYFVSYGQPVTTATTDVQSVLSKANFIIILNLYSLLIESDELSNLLRWNRLWSNHTKTLPAIISRKTLIQVEVLALTRYSIGDKICNTFYIIEIP